MINAAFAHSIELDDGHKNAGCHAGAVVVPTALAMGQELGSTGKEILTAVVMGYEVTYRIAANVNPAQISKGFHPSSNCGAYGAMAAAGKLMKLDPQQLANGLGQAGMLASGTMEATRSGQRSKCVQVGNAAWNGIAAAYLAQSGMEGCLSALEGKDGLFATQSAHVDVAEVCRDLGKVYSIGDTYNKLYPSCRHAQPGIEAVLDLIRAHGVVSEDVASIWIGTHQVAYDLTGIIKAPKNAGEAKFSLAYGAAIALKEHSFGVAHLTQPYYTDPAILALADKVTVEVDPAVQAVYPKQRGARVKITLCNGGVLEKELYDLKGSPRNPVGWSELQAKFIANAKAVLPMENIRSLLSQITDFETQTCVDSLLALLS
jgi:2-methylcitrate dehydratase PrpD